VWFDRLTTNEINQLPFVLGLSKDLLSVSLIAPISLRETPIAAAPGLLGHVHAMLNAISWGVA